MQTLLLATRWPLFVVLTFFALLWGCQKDRFTPLNAPAPAPDGGVVSLEQAKAYFDAQAFNPDVASFSDDSAKFYLKLLPLWEQSYTGISPAGREMLMVPLADSSFSQMNGGRANAELVFNNMGGDTVLAQILVYVADSAYYAEQAGVLNFSTFSGAFLFFGLDYDFHYGVVVSSGSPFGSVRSLIQKSVVGHKC
jgi:hypothetical protein